MKKLFVVTIAIATILASSANAQQGLDSGWYVIVASDPLTADGAQTSGNHGVINAKVGGCGFTPFNDFSGKFMGFTPGYEVYVLGAYASKAEANAIRQAVRPCVPDAYIKFGRYAGE